MNLPRLSLTLLILLCHSPQSPAAISDDEVSDRKCFILSGLGGLPEYEENFVSWADSIETVCREQMRAMVVRLDGREDRLDLVTSEFQRNASVAESGELWVFLIGHGTYDGRKYKFNIKGPDLTGEGLVELLKPLADRKVYVIAATSCSGALLKDLQGPNRVVLTATKSGTERFAPLFMSFFVEASESAEADTNKDRRISLEEVFTFSDVRIKAWYEEKGQIQTEHPVLNDAGGAGNLATFAYLSSPSEQAYRSLEAQQLVPDRIRLEREIEDLKRRKAEMPESQYYSELERLLVELAQLNARIRELEGEQ